MEKNNFPGFGEWVHEAVTIRDGNLTAWVNGQAIDSTTVGPDYTLRQPNATLYLGSLLYVGGPINKMVRNNMNGRFNGDVDEMMLFPRALSEAELQALMAKPYELSGGAVDPVLFFKFDQAPVDPLMHGAVSGLYVCTNLGTAGRDYDLLMGQLNDDYGYGTTYVDKADVWNTPRPWSAPRVHASSVPWTASEWALDATLPLVYEVAAGGFVDVPLPSNRSGLRLGQVLPAGGTVSAGFDALNTTLASGADLGNETSVRFWPGASLAGPVVFTLEQGPVVQEVHVWPIKVPMLSEVDAVKDVFTFQDEPVNIFLGTDYISNVGEEVELVITSLPHGGQLRTYDVDSTWSSANSSLIDTVPSRLAPRGLAVTYIPESGFKGRDRFAVAFRSPATGLSSVALAVSVEVRFIDTTAQCEPLGHDVVLDEDQVGGVPNVVLKAHDVEQTFGLARFISKLPERGDLYVISELGVERMVTAPFISFRDIGASVRQYASRVEGFSTFYKTGDDPLSYHPLCVLGSPTCDDKARTFNDVCVSPRLMNGTSWTGWMPPAGDVIKANKLFNASRPYNESDPRWMVAASVVRGPYRGVMADGNTTLLIDARVLRMYKEDGNGTCVRCEMVGPDYPDDCSTAAVTTVTEQGLLLVGLPWRHIKIPNGVWSGASSAGVAGEQRGGTCAYGPQFRYVYDQTDNYITGGYTEFIELGYETAVYPTAVNVGMNRGGGAIVSILAKSQATGRWQRLYAGAVQKLKYSETNSVGLYYTFDEPVCRAAFKTSVLRIELDTSAATGIADWNCIDYVELVGAVDAQPALLLNGTDSVRYVPRPDEHGDDSFEFRTTDCVGKDLRSSEPSVVSIKIAPKPDAPLFEVSPAEPIYRCGLDTELALALVSVALDGDTLRDASGFCVGDMCDSVSLRVARGADALDPDPLRPFAKRWMQHAAVSVDCAAFESGAKSVNLRLVTVANDSGLSSLAVVALTVLKPDLHVPGPWLDIVLAAEFAIIAALAALSVVWMVRYRKHQVVRIAQLPFLLAFIFGVLLNSSAIIAVRFNDVNSSQQAADFACTWLVWAYSIGYVFVLATVYVKLDKAERLTSPGFLDTLKFGAARERFWAELHVSVPGMAARVLAVVLVDVVLITALTWDAPVTFQRRALSSSLVVSGGGSAVAVNYTLSSSGMCASERFEELAASVLVFHLVLLAWLARICYRSWGIHEALAEHRSLTVLILSALQTLILSVPVIVLTRNDAVTNAFAFGSVVFLTNVVSLAVLLLPKVLMKRSGSVVTFYSVRPGLDPSAQSGDAAGRSPVIKPRPAGSIAMTGTKITKAFSKGSASVLPATQLEGAFNV